MCSLYEISSKMTCKIAILFLKIWVANNQPDIQHGSGKYSREYCLGRALFMPTIPIKIVKRLQIIQEMAINVIVEHSFNYYFCLFKLHFLLCSCKSQWDVNQIFIMSFLYFSCRGKTFSQ